MSGDLFGALLVGGIGGAILRQPELDSARQTAQYWYTQYWRLNKEASDSKWELLAKSIQGQFQDNTLKAKNAEIARLTEILASACIQAYPELPPPGSNTHHSNGNGNH